MNTEHFKGRLEEELSLLTRQLGDIAAEGENGVWQAKAPYMDVMTPQAEPNEAADKIEEIDERSEEVVTLSARLIDVKKAMASIEEGTYGTCEVCQAPIGEDRLEANPAARTCTLHM